MSISDDIATLDELVKDKRAEMNNHARARDRYHDDMRKCQIKRNNYRDNAQAIMKKISELKAERAHYNELTQEAKANRDWSMTKLGSSCGGKAVGVVS